MESGYEDEVQGICAYQDFDDFDGILATEDDDPDGDLDVRRLINNPTKEFLTEQILMIRDDLKWVQDYVIFARQNFDYYVENMTDDDPISKAGLRSISKEFDNSYNALKKLYDVTLHAKMEETDE